MPPRHPLPLAPNLYVGLNRYHLRFCTEERRAIFTKGAAVDLLREQIARAATEEQISVVVYCFMPDHLHLLVEGTTDASDCRRFVTRAKQYSGYHHARRFGERLWQRYSYDSVLRDDELTAVVAKYILANPIRAGLVTRVEDYPFVGSFVYQVPELLEWVRQSG